MQTESENNREQGLRKNIFNKKQIYYHAERCVQYLK